MMSYLKLLNEIIFEKSTENMVSDVLKASPTFTHYSLLNFVYILIVYC